MSEHADRPKSLSVFFPAYNEQDNLGTLVDQTMAAVAPLTDDYEIIIVNDGSSDRTREVADELAARFPQVRAVHHEQNQGYGGGLITGFASATKEAVFFSDSDLQFNLAEIDKFWEAIGREDVVVGYRMKRADPFVRRLNAFCWGRLIRILFGFKIRDLDCAFKMFRREVVEDITLASRGATITVELMARIHRKGIRWKQIGVHHYPRHAGEQTGAKPHVILKAFLELFKLKKRLKREARK